MLFLRRTAQLHSAIFIAIKLPVATGGGSWPNQDDQLSSIPTTKNEKSLSIFKQLNLTLSKAKPWDFGIGRGFQRSMRHGAESKATRMYSRRPLEPSPIPKSSTTVNLNYSNGFHKISRNKQQNLVSSIFSRACKTKIKPFWSQPLRNMDISCLPPNTKQLIKISNFQNFSHIRLYL